MSSALAPHPTLPTPPPLMMSEPGTFAYYTITERWPKIVRQIQAEQNFDASVQAELTALVNELLHGTVELNVSGEDQAAWRSHMSPYQGQSWFDVPWFLAETYFYRRILEATGYFSADETQGIDPFAVQKQQGLNHAIAQLSTLSHQLCQWYESTDWSPVPWRRDWMRRLILDVLWGNQADLSLRPGEATNQATQQEEQILVNDVEAVLDRLENCDRTRVDIVADNAGAELVCDLFLAHALVATGKAGQVHLHLKNHPTFVSDATERDVYQTLWQLANVQASGVDEELDQANLLLLQSLALEISAYVDRGQIRLQAHPFWTSPLPAWEMPVDLQQELVRSQLVIFKGDANYRRLLGDRTWEFTESFQTITDYFPAPLLALRTIKSNVAAGLDAATVQSLTQRNPDWTTVGEWGLMQYTARS